MLIPGLIFFASQVAQVSGTDWLFLMQLRAGYFMIIPVLIVWLWKRRFPIWGLIPLGLLFKTLLSLENRLGYYYEQFLPVVAPRPPLSWAASAVNALTPFNLEVAILIVLFLAIIGLAWFARRRVGIPRFAWIGLGVYGLLAASILYTYFPPPIKQGLAAE